MTTTEHDQAATDRASAGTAGWAGVFDAPMLATMGLRKSGTLPDGPHTLYEFETTHEVCGCVRLGDGCVFVRGTHITSLTSMAELIDLLRLLRFFV